MTINSVVNTSDILLARQSIVKADHSIYGFEVL